MIAEESKRFRLLRSDTHVQVAREGDAVLQVDDAESRPRHVNVTIMHASRCAVKNSPRRWRFAIGKRELRHSAVFRR